MPGELTVRSILRSSHLLRALSDDELDSLAVDCRMYRVEKSETIWTHGSTVDFFGLVGFGFVKMTKTTPTGTDVSLEIMGPGQIFGLLGVLTGDGCSLSAVALTDSVYVRIPKGAFERVYEGSGPLKDKLLRKTALRMHQKLDFMAMLSTGKVEERIAAVLFILAESYGELDGRLIRVGVPLTRQHIAELAGTTTESTIRTLSKWTQDGLLTTEHQFITIQDVPGLEAKLQPVRD